MAPGCQDIGYLFLMTGSVPDGYDAAGSVRLPYRSKTDLVTEYLRNELQAGRPRAGERLVVARVAERLGVSKVPVREAVTGLIGEGLLILRPNVGPVVPEFTAHEVLETALMRVAIEGVALDSAVSQHSDASLDGLRALLGSMEDADSEFPALNVRFHLAVISPSPYAEMVRLASTLLERAQRYAIVHAVPGYRDEAHAEHLAIFDALVDRDIARLKVLNEQHVTTAARRLTEQMSSPG